MALMQSSIKVRELHDVNNEILIEYPTPNYASGKHCENKANMRRCY